MTVAFAPALAERVAEVTGEASGARLELDVRRVVELGDGRESRRGRERVSRERAGLVHRPERCQLVHHVGAPAERGERQSAADHLAEHGEVGGDPVARLRTSPPEPEAGDHLVEHEQCPGLGAAVAETIEEPRARGHQAHVGGHRFHQHRRELGARLREHQVECLVVVVGRDDRVGHRAVGDARRAGETECGDPAARRDQERVGVAVVAAGELEDLGAAGRAAGEAHRGHPGFGPGRHEPYLLDRGHRVADRLRQLHFASGGRTERRAFGRGALHRFDDARVGVTEDRRPPRLHVVEVAVAVGVDE